MSNLTLWCYPRTSARATMIALEEAGLAYETRLFDIMKGDQFRPAFLTRSPKHQIPVLFVDDRPLTESSAILSFLMATTLAGRLGPEDAFGRAEATAVVAWLASGSLTALLRIVRPYRISADPAAADGIADMARATIRENLQIAERHMRGRAWWLERWSVADAYLFYLFGDAANFGVDLSGMSALADFAARSAERPAVRRVVEWETRTLQTLS